MEKSDSEEDSIETCVDSCSQQSDETEIDEKASNLTPDESESVSSTSESMEEEELSLTVSFPLTELVVTDLATIQKSVWEARLKWFHIGLELGVACSTLKVIESNYPLNTDRKFTDMLEEWLKNSKPTYGRLINALKASTVGFEEMSQHLMSKLSDVVANSLASYGL